MKQHVLIVLATVALTALAYAIGDSGSPVAAKSSDEPVPCTLVATTGKIDIFLCEPENGIAPFLQNSYGFMRDAE